MLLDGVAFCQPIAIMTEYYQQTAHIELPAQHYERTSFIRKRESNSFVELFVAVGILTLVTVYVRVASVSSPPDYASRTDGFFAGFFSNTNDIATTKMPSIVTAELVELNATIAGRVWLPKDGAQFVSAARVWRLDQALPMAVIEVANEQDVMWAVSVLAELYKSHQIPFRIRSGGHNKAGYSTVADGIVLSLKQMKQRSVDVSSNHSIATSKSGPKETTIMATIQPGARVEDILDTFLVDEGDGAGHGYAGALGTCGKVAEGGWVLGGGFGFMTRLVGLGVDNVYEFRIVLASGKIKVCSSTENADLFWALRGAGSGNYGVITEMKYSLFSVPDKQLFKTVTIPFDDLGDFLYELGEKPPSREFEAVVAGRDGDYAKAFLSWFSTDESTILKGDRHYYEEIKPFLPPRASAPASYDEFLWTESTHAYFDRGYGEAVKSAEVWQGFLFPVNNTRAVWKHIMDIIYHGMKIAPDLEPHIELWGGAVSDVDSSETAFPYRKAIYNVGVQLVIPEVSPTSQLRFRQQVSGVNEWWPKVAYYLTGSYLNYPMNSLSRDEYPRLYWGDNLERLVELKQKYDPDNIFSYEQSMPWSLKK